MMLRLGLAGRARRADQAGHHAVHRDIVAGEIVRERAREADQPGLGGDHVRAVLGAGMRREAADIDDGAGLALAQLRQAGLHAVEGAVEHDRHDLAPFLVAQLLERLLAAQRRVVDENIDAAEPLHRGGRHLLHRLGVGDVGGDRERLAAGLLDLAHDRLGLA